MNMSPALALSLYDVPSEAGLRARRYIHSLAEDNFAELLGLLDHENRELRPRLIKVLGELQTERAFSVLTELSSTSNYELACAIACALAGYGSVALPFIEKILNNRRWSRVERDVFLAAAASCGPEAAELLILQQDGDLNQICKHALLSYGRHAIDPLIRGLKRKERSIVTFCQKVLAEMADHSADSVILLALDAMDVELRLNAIETLGYFPRNQERAIRALVQIIEQEELTVEAPPPKKPGRFVFPLLQSRRNDSDNASVEQVRRFAVCSIASIAQYAGDDRARVRAGRQPTFMAVPVLCDEALPVLRRHLTRILVSNEPSEMHAALKTAIAQAALADYGSVSRNVLEQMLRSEHPAVREAGVEILTLVAQRLSERARAPYRGDNPAYRLSAMLEATDRSCSARAFAQRRLKGFALLIPLLRELLRDPGEEEQVLRGALDALAGFYRLAKSATPEILTHLRQGREEAFEALRCIQPWDEETRSALRDALAGSQASIALKVIATYRETASVLAADIIALTDNHSLSEEALRTLSLIDPDGVVTSDCLS